MSGISQRYMENIQSVFDIDFKSSVFKDSVLFLDMAPEGVSTTVLNRILSFNAVKGIDIISKKQIWQFFKDERIKKRFDYRKDFFSFDVMSEAFWENLDKSYDSIIISTNENPRSSTDFLNYFNIWKLFFKIPAKTFFIDRSFCLKNYYSFMGIKKGIFVEDKEYFFYMMVSHQARQTFVNRAYEAAKTGEVVEIGRAFGGSSVALALVVGENGLVHSVDIKTDDLFEEYLSFYGLRERIRCYNSGSLSTNYLLKREIGRKISFVFIDGDHREEAIALDIRLWSDLLISGGTICLHEYGHNDINQSTRVIYEEIVSKPDKFYDFKRIGDLFFARKR